MQNLLFITWTRIMSKEQAASFWAHDIPKIDGLVNGLHGDHGFILVSTISYCINVSFESATTIVAEPLENFNRIVRFPDHQHQDSSTEI